MPIPSLSPVAMTLQFPHVTTCRSSPQMAANREKEERRARTSWSSSCFGCEDANCQRWGHISVSVLNSQKKSIWPYIFVLPSEELIVTGIPLANREPNPITTTWFQQHRHHHIPTCRGFTRQLFQELGLMAPYRGIYPNNEPFAKKGRNDHISTWLYSTIDGITPVKVQLTKLVCKVNKLVVVIDICIVKQIHEPTYNWGRHHVLRTMSIFDILVPYYSYFPKNIHIYATLW